ncbi:hypothetical protein WJX72_001441 [[Myrmecia] bisecta]|uniref:SAP domain-containing protein n=1 Tax=[Myrmecia] bisecta TaxID=41462 RepID=A0AAW1QP99_9CHLO
MNLPQETEWPANPHLQLHQALDERARCSICHEFYRTPLSLPCAHTCKRAKPRLTVPPKLVWNLLGSDKAVRDKLKAVNLPTKGSRKVMEERYHRYRVMVETAIDAGEHVTHQQLLERLAAREKGLADAAEDQPRVRAVKQAAPAGASASFEDLIAATNQNSSRLANGPLDRVASAPEPDHRKASHGRAIPAGHVADGIVIDVDGDGSEDETVEDSEPEDDIGSQPGQRHGAHGFAPQQAPHAALRFQYS